MTDATRDLRADLLANTHALFAARQWDGVPGPPLRAHEDSDTVVLKRGDEIVDYIAPEDARVLAAQLIASADRAQGR